MKTELRLVNFGNIVYNKAAEANESELIRKIWEKDYTVWNDSPAEITNRLGWLDISFRMEKTIGSINDFVDEIKNDFDNVLVLGMGGSSLAPDVFSKVFGSKEDFPNLHVIDSTHPDFIHRITGSIDLRRTLFIVSTKSGGTAETVSLMKYYLNICRNAFDNDAGKHFVAITDPGSGLEKIAQQLGFRKIFLNDPDIGGRFSSLSYFGLVPAGIIGVDLKKLLSTVNRAICVAQNLDCLDVHHNSSALTGIAIGELFKKGRNKLTFITNKGLANFGDWVEQLIAESTGKNGKGILPVVDEDKSFFEYYGNDRVVVIIRLEGDELDKNIEKDLLKRNIPVIVQTLENTYQLGELMYFWEFATAVAGWVMEIHPFNQPDVESAKIAARQLMEQYSESGKLPELNYNFEDETLKVNTTVEAERFDEIVNKFLSLLNDKYFPYVAVHSYTDYRPELNELLFQLRKTITAKYNVPVTVGYGPRFLHSTGQLHKGDDGSGLFIQLFEEPKNDLDIPDEPASDDSSISFGVLVRAQSLGDRKALIDNGRAVLRMESNNIFKAVTRLTKIIETN